MVAIYVVRLELWERNNMNTDIRDEVDQDGVQLIRVGGVNVVILHPKHHVATWNSGSILVSYNHQMEGLPFIYDRLRTKLVDLNTHRWTSPR